MVTPVIGGVEYQERITSQVIVATPGKMIALMNKLINMSNVKLLVLDEADDIIEHSQFSGICMTVRRAAPKAQVLMFSATFECLEPINPGMKKARGYTDAMFDAARMPPVTIRIVSRNPAVTHFYAPLPPTDNESEAFNRKVRFLLEIYDCLIVGKTMIFVRTREAAVRLTEAMRAAGHKLSVITGSGDKGMDQKARMQVQEEFTKGVTKVLVCTSVMARGTRTLCLVFAHACLPFMHVSIPFARGVAAVHLTHGAGCWQASHTSACYHAHSLWNHACRYRHPGHEACDQL